MAAVTKSDGRYFYDNDKVWNEAEQSGVRPFWVGDWWGKVSLPPEPTRAALKGLCEGKAFLGRVQANRVGCFDLTFTFSKSVSIALFGMTPPREWAKSSQTLVDATRPDVEALVGSHRVNVGAQGKGWAPAKGGAAGFCHWSSSRGDPHAHVQYAVPNLTATHGGETKSIANASVMFDQQGVLRARAQKRLDDLLQAQGYLTVRQGKSVGIAGIPDKMIAELSSARRAMEQARAEKQFTGARAHDFYARQARRDAGPARPPTPEEVAERVRRAAVRFGVTPQSLKRHDDQASPAASPVRSASVAYDVAEAARDACAQRYGSFSSGQFFERLYTLGIGKDTTLEALDTFGRMALVKPNFVGIACQRRPDGTVRYSRVGPRQPQQTAKAQSAQQGPQPGPSAQQQQASQQQQQQTQQRPAPTFQPDTAAAWEELKKAARGLAAAVLVKTAQTAASAITRIAEAVNPPPRTVTVQAQDLPAFIDRHKPTPYLLAHAKALLKGALAPGNPHAKAAVAEQAYAKYRAYDRLPKNTVLVVDGARHASARELQQLSRIAQRDRACVILAEGPDPGRAQGRQRDPYHERQGP